MERYHIFKLGLAILFYAAYCIRPMIATDESDNVTKKFDEEDLVFYQGVTGKPGVDFPVLSHIPRTTFSCRDVDSGYYADLETDCQVFHICEEGKKISFLCPNGTIFQQSELICEWWFKVNCSNAPSLYEESAEQLREDNARRKASRRVQNHGAVMRTEEHSSVSASQNGRNFDIGGTNRASKRISNHNFKQSNDLSRSQGADFVRNQNGRKPVQFQIQAKVNNDESSTKSREKIHSLNTGFQQQNQRRKPIQNEYRGQNQFGTSPSQNQKVVPNYSNDLKNNRNSDGSQDQNRFEVKQVVPVKSQQYQNYHRNSNQFSLNTQQYQGQSGNTNQFNRGFQHQNNTINTKFSTTSGNGQIVPSTGNQFVKNSQNQDNGFETNSENKNVLPSSTFPPNQSGIKNNQVPSNFNNRQNQGGADNQFNQNNRRNDGANAENMNVVPHAFNNQQYQNDNRHLERQGRKNSQFEQYQNIDRSSFGANNEEKKVVPNQKVIVSEQSRKDNNQFFNNGFQDSNTDSVESTTYRPTTTTLRPVSTTTQTQTTRFQIKSQTDFKKPANNYFSNKSNFGSTSTPFSTTTNLQNHKLTENTNSASTSGQDKNLDLGGKSGTVSLTRNDIVNQRLEPTDSDEFQITQETSSFYKNSFNRIDQDVKSTANPHPNHRSTYSDLKEPSTTKYQTKTFSISSVTPQYLTTQPINNGKPFIGSQVGTTLGSSGTTKAFNYFTTTTVPPELFNTGGTDKSLRPIALSTVSTFAPLLNLTVPSQGSFNTGTTPRTFSSTKKVIDHATVYGKFSKSSATTPAIGNKKILLSKSVFSGTTQSTTHKTSAEILSTSDSYNRGVPQVRFFGKVQTTTSKVPGVQIRFGGNSVTSRLVPDEKPNSAIASSTALPLSITSSTAPVFGTTGFFVTRNTLNVTTTPKSVINDIVRPRPFQLPPEPDVKGQAVYSTTTETLTTPTPTYLTYKISSASPFAPASTLKPTQPTPFSTAKTVLPSTFNNVDSMITALAEMANYSDSPRPGLVIPPSAGPQTLHTLAQYFANALDGIEKDEELEEEDEDEENLTRVELEKKRLTELLTQMTMNRYNELFHDQSSTTVATRLKSEDEENDLEGQHSKSPATPAPKVRQLAKVFTQALSSYLDDPQTFKKVLEEVRPTEPPELNTTELEDDELLNFSDADVKSSYPPFFPPTPPAVRPTWGYLVAYNNNTHNLDVKNSIGPEGENLQGADSQSFVSQFNKLQQKETSTRSSVLPPEDHWTASPGATKLWKTAFSFDPASINNNFGSTTEATDFTTETPLEETEPIKEDPREIKYELRALPQLDLNQTQLHGILIDFMNTTKNEEDNRLQRILRKLNTTEDEFLSKMKEIEGNPLTRRLILLLISECGNSTKVDAKAVPLHSLLGRSTNTEILQTSSSNSGFGTRGSTSDVKIVDPTINEESEDARALQLLNSLYAIASRFGK